MDSTIKLPTDSATVAAPSTDSETIAFIEVQGARVNNLKNINLRIPRDQFVVITGLSGSGKSSLAFETLYAEGQRRYVESLSAYARQFLGRMSKPEVDFIKGIPPAIAIEQKVNTRNPRSTVGTSTEIYDYLRLLYARIGRTFSPVSGQEVKKHTVEDVIDYINTFPDGTRFYILCPLVIPEGRTLAMQLETLLKQGFTRIESDGHIISIESLLQQPDQVHGLLEPLYVLIDRMTVEHDKAAESRMADSIETAFYEGRNVCYLRIFSEEVEQFRAFSKQFEADGLVFEEPSDQLFSFNSPIGACPTCEGFGKIIGIDEDLVIPNKSLSIYEDAIACWRGEKMSEWKQELVANADKFGFPIFRPWYQLTDEQRQLVWTGNEWFRGLNQFFKMLEENQYKIQYRVMLARYRGKTICPTCHGNRLKKEATYVKVGGKAITELINLPISELALFFEQLSLTDYEKRIADRILSEINNRVRCLLDVGLGYLTLNRLSSTLSGGESQRINLATSLGSSLVGSMYILDEPSIGLHARDTHRLINVLRQLQGLGNTVIVVEHDEEIMRAADYLIDMGPDAGRLGGEVVYQGPAEEWQYLLARWTNGLSGEKINNVSDKGKKTVELSRDKTILPRTPEEEAHLIEKLRRSYTMRYLTHQEQIPVPAVRRPWNQYIEVVSAHQHNLKGINVRFPLHVMTVVTGVSGSGKSSLVRDVFYAALKRYYGGTVERAGLYGDLRGDLKQVKGIELVDQNPIGKSSRSNPVTYLKAWDEIRKLYTDQPLARQMGYTPSYFSFNVAGGRCEECQGEGTIVVEMQFMADLRLTCEACHGKRFKPELLEVEYRGLNIADVLELTVDQAIEFFGVKPGAQEKKVLKRLMPLQEVGLGYIKLGQSSSTLSGGENQRVKLASFLSDEHAEPTIYVFDEPSTGLHFHDIRILLKAFDALIEKGHTVIIIEHNMEIIKQADYVIDLGPEGGDQGGYLVYAGTPEGLVGCRDSYTGRYLKSYLT
jgi:excinuclease ABC subunit A